MIRTSPQYYYLPLSTSPSHVDSPLLFFLLGNELQ